jgi:thiol-disulfide isomerase/thioredoxin
VALNIVGFIKVNTSMKNILLVSIILGNLMSGKSQAIIGNLKEISNQTIKLEGFRGFQTYPISTTTSDENGNFKLNYSKSDIGVGYLKFADSKPIFVMLSGEELEIVGEYADAEKIRITKGKENQLFETYAKEQPRREQTLSAWAYLEKIYQSDSLFSSHKIPSQSIIAEKKRIKKEEELFLQSLPEGSYVKWFLPNRKLVSNVSVLAQYRTEEIPSAIAAFRALDYTDPRLYKSGLFKDAIESHFWLLENSGKSLDSVFIEMKLSIDAMMSHLIKDEKKLNEVTDYLFDLLERQSLFQASEYLALKALNETSCTLNSDLAKQLETYRAMKKGNTAPEILFTSNILAPNYANKKLPEKLSEIETKYTTVVFGASWCPKCKEELPEIAKQYQKWNANSVEVVFVSLDEDRAAYEAFAKDFPFISTCDFKKWESKMAKDYYVFGTPTMFLIDQNRKIILRPTSVKQMDAWVDWYLVQSNPLPK